MLINVTDGYYFNTALVHNIKSVYIQKSAKNTPYIIINMTDGTLQRIETSVDKVTNEFKDFMNKITEIQN